MAYIAGNMGWVDNGVIRVGMDSNAGGAITTVYDLIQDGTSINLVDTTIQQSYYAGHRVLNPSEQIFVPTHADGWPWNPVQSENYTGNASPMISFYADGDAIQSECMPLLWDRDDTAQARITQRMEPEPNIDNAVRVTCTFISQRPLDDEWGSPQHTLAQELPVALFNRYVSGGPEFIFYNGRNPWTNESLSTIPVNFGVDDLRSSLYPSEHWVGVRHNGDKVVALYGLGGRTYSSTHKWVGGNKGGSIYLSPHNLVTLDRDAVISYRYWVIVGNTGDVRNSIYNIYAQHPIESVSYSGTVPKVFATYDDYSLRWHWETLDNDYDGTSRYRLEPEVLWTDTLDEELIINPAPPLGEYTFHVQERSREHDWSDSGSITINTMDDHYEDNDGFNNATEVEHGSYNGLVCNDDDYYKIFLDTDDTITVAVGFRTAEGNINLHLYDPVFSMVAASVSTTDHEYITHTATMRGFYYIKVSQLGSGNTYDLVINMSGFSVISSPKVLGPYISIDSTPTWTWETTSLFGTGNFRYKLDGGEWHLTYSTIFVPSVPLNNGLHTLYVQERGSSGSWSDSGTHTIAIDAIDPPYVTGEELTTNASPVWTWTSENGSGIFRYKLNDGDWSHPTTDSSWRPLSALTDGFHELYVQEQNAFGQWSVSNSHVTTIDTEAPNPPIIDTLPTYISNTQPTWTWASGGGGAGTFRYQVDSESDSEIPIVIDGDIAWLNNGIVKLGVHRNYGGAFTSAYDLRTDPLFDYVNTTDRGREIQQSYYAGNAITGPDQCSAWSPWSWNPIQAGDCGYFAPEMLDFRVIGKSIYSKCIPMLWDRRNHPAQATMEQWSEFEEGMNDVIRVTCRLNCMRDAGDPWNGPGLLSPQELPACYFNRTFTNRLMTYEGSSPWTGDTLVEIPESFAPWAHAYPTEHWAAATYSSSMSIGIYSVGAVGSGGGWNMGGVGDTLHMAPIGTMRLYYESVVNYRFWIILGDLDHIRDRAYELHNRYPDEEAYVGEHQVWNPGEINIPEPTSGWVETTNTAWMPANPLSDGLHALFVQEKDEAGLWSASAVDYTTVDTVPPSDPIVHGDTITNNNTPTWTWVSGGGGNGTFRYSIDEGAWVTTSALAFTPSFPMDDGPHLLRIQEQDNAGNWSNITYFTTVIDSTPPDAPVIDGPDTTKNRFPVLTWSSSGGTGEFRYRFDGGSWEETTDVSWVPDLPLMDGSYNFEVQERDELYNWSNSGAHSFVVDNVSPLPPLVDGDDITSNTMPTWTWTSGGGGNGTFRYQLDSTSNLWRRTTNNQWTPEEPLSDGPHRLYVVEEDGAGNKSGYGSHVIIIDTTPPPPPIVAGPTFTSNVTPTWAWVSGGGDGSGVFRHKLEDGEWMETTSNIWTPSTPLIFGRSYQLFVQEKDAVGNWSLSGNHTIVIGSAVPSVPRISVENPTSNPMPAWAWVSGGGGNGVFRYRLDGGPWIDGGNSFTPASPLSEGTHTLCVQEQNHYGHWSAPGSSISFVDLTAPEAPDVTGHIATASLRPTWHWTGDGIFKYKLDDGPWTEIHSNYFTPQYDLSPGPHTLSVQERDSAGNWSESGDHTIIIDTTNDSFLEQAFEARQKTSTQSFGGYPHRWIELFGGKALQLLTHHPNIESFRDRWYYNTVENELYSKLMWWQATDADISEYSHSGFTPSKSAVGLAKESTSNRIVEAFACAPDPYNYHDDYYYNTCDEIFYRKRASWQRYGSIFTMGEYDKYIDGKFTNPEYPSFYRFVVIAPTNINPGVPFDVIIQAVRISDDEIYNDYVPDDSVDVYLDISTSLGYQVSPVSIDDTGWDDGSKTVTMQILNDPPHRDVFTILVIQDLQNNIVGGTNIHITDD